MTVESTDAGERTVVVEVSGDLVVTNRDELGEAIEAALDRRRSVVVSCAGLDHVDTPALALLVQLRQRFVEERLALSVAGLPPRFHDLMADIRIREKLPLHDTVEEGLDRRDA